MLARSTRLNLVVPPVALVCSTGSNLCRAHWCAQEAEGASFKMKSVDEKKADYDHANKEVGLTYFLILGLRRCQSLLSG